MPLSGWAMVRKFAVDRSANVTARLHPHVLHAAQNRMNPLVLDERDARALSMVRAVVPDPGLSKT